MIENYTACRWLGDRDEVRTALLALVMNDCAGLIGVSTVISVGAQLSR